ncbi:hypothetical protein RN001_002709 [Aquatica leii]|uniref:Uncharacterized protein n=1 Tax=Aquatica leii TaxID=1421715 RepID=A0AAN7SRC1_9COLE|nr:hypothetical protein RN001_002709 [Aquatica leii]
MASLKELIARRAVAKGSLTRFKNYCIELGENIDLIDLQNRMQRFEPLFDTFSAVQLQIEIIDDDNTVAHDSERTAFESEYFEYLAYAKRLLTNSNSRNFCESSSNTSASGILSDLPVKLPQINLPTFDGVQKILQFQKITSDEVLGASTDFIGLKIFQKFNSNIDTVNSDNNPSLRLLNEHNSNTLSTEDYFNQNLPDKLLQNELVTEKKFSAEEIMNMPVLFSNNLVPNEDSNNNCNDDNSYIKNYLVWQKTPERLGKRQTEKLPYSWDRESYEL